MALKIFRSGKHQNGTSETDDIQREIEIMAKIDSPFFAKIYDYGFDGCCSKPSGDEIQGLPYIL